MKQIDFVGEPEQEPTPFKDIRNTRPQLADEKAVLLLELGKMLNSVPAKVRNGSVQDVRLWRDARKTAAKVAGNPRSSKQGISSAINRMRGWL